jgi:ribosomal protein S18 acetylase RimI-like enzyme
VVTVREATVDDLDGCLDLIEAVVNEGQWLGMQPPFDRVERRERLLANLADERCITLVAADEAGWVPERSAGCVPERNAGCVPERNAGCVPERNAGCVPERNAGCVPERNGGGIIGHLGLHVAPHGVADVGMCVAPDARERGIGSALLKEALEAARRMGAHKVTLQVWPHNGPARRLYRRFGFQDEGRLRRHYARRNGELWDAIVMGLVLDDERPGSSIPDDAPTDAPADA